MAAASHFSESSAFVSHETDDLADVIVTVGDKHVPAGGIDHKETN